jgi:hypothetical protein
MGSDFSRCCKDHDPVLGRLQQLGGVGKVGVVPLHVEVPVAAGGDLCLRDNADVDIVVSQQV